MNKLLQQVQTMVENEQVVDQTKGGESFTYTPPAAGTALARFVSYVELGKRPQKPYKGKPKPDAKMVRIGFELYGKGRSKEIEYDGEKRTVQDYISITIPVKSGDKAGFVQLLKTMRYGRTDKTHMALMLGEGFLVKVVHADNGETGDKKRVYANLRTPEGAWTISAPVKEDPESGAVPYKVPAPTRDLQLFLWDNPTKEQWDSIFIDGTREVDGETVSKNRIQEDIINNATDFEGSALEALLNELGGLKLDGGKAKAEESVEADLDDEIPFSPDEEADPLAGLDV